jgi:signal peptidase II
MQRLRWIVFVAIVLGVTGCDHATKLMASSMLTFGHGASLISGVLSLDRTHNTDTAFGMLAGVVPLASRLWTLKVTATLGSLLVAVFATVRLARAKTVERIALALLLGGALGNAIDRWRWGYVVDFIRVEHWPTFNVADMALCVGVGLLLLARARARRSCVVGVRS